MLSFVRQRFRTLALVTAMAQLLVIGSVSVALCCQPAQKSAENVEDCCPAGSHPDGVCPLHGKKSKESRPASDCRLTCAAKVHGQMLLPSGAPVVTVLSIGPPAEAHATALPVVTPVLTVDLVPNTPPPKA
jgi:hypothetical protein